MIRLLDILLSLTGLIMLFPALLILLFIGWCDTRSPLFLQERVGQQKKPFTLVKFRTMRVESQSVASHLADQRLITSYGRFLRKTKLDELPQLINVLIGDMSFVGPRPCLFNQTDLIHLRSEQGIFNVRPGITGISQINGIDMSTPEQLVHSDARMIRAFNVRNYLRLIIVTLLGKGRGDPISRYSNDN